MAIDYLYFSLRCWNALNMDIFADYRPKHSLGLSAAQAKALYAVFLNEGNLLTFYAAELRLKNASFTSIVSTLESAKLVVCEKDKTDKRAKLLKLTEKGRIYAEAVGDDLNEYLRDKLSPLSDAEKKTFVDSLSALERLCVKYGL